MNNPSALIFHFESKVFGKFKIKIKIDDNFPMDKLFESVQVNLKLRNSKREAFTIPVLPKLKDDKGNVYCELYEESEKILEKMWS